MIAGGYSSGGGAASPSGSATVLPPQFFSYPGLGAPFARAVATLKLDEDITFGTAATGAGAIRDATELAAKFRPLEGEFAANGSHIGGTGPTTINSEPQNYRDTFDGRNHIFDADGLRLQSKVEAGTYDVIVRGALTSGATTGLNINLPGGTVTTTIADVGLTANDLDLLEIGTVFSAANYGFACVAAKDKTAGTITFEEVTSGFKSQYKNNFALVFSKIAFCRIEATKTIAINATTIPLARPLPSWVVPGMLVRGIQRGSTSTAGKDPQSNRDMVVGTIAADRMSFTIPKGFSIGNGQTLEGAYGAGVMILPGLYSAQVWSLKGYGSQLFDTVSENVVRKRVAQAIRIEMTMPLQTWAAPAGVYSKAAMEAFLAANPTAALGFFPALWLYPWRPGPGGVGQSSTASFRWNEIDIMETFGRPGMGGRVLTNNRHDIPYYRRRNVNNAAPGNRHRSLKATWETYDPVAQNDFKVLSPNSLNLTFDASLTDGVKHSYAVILTDDKIIQYFDDVVICEDSWSVETDFPYQLGMNLANGMMTGAQAANYMLPQSNAMAEQWIKIHRVQSWTL